MWNLSFIPPFPTTATGFIQSHSTNCLQQGLFPQCCAFGSLLSTDGSVGSFCLSLSCTDFPGTFKSSLTFSPGQSLSLFPGRCQHLMSNHSLTFTASDWYWVSKCVSHLASLTLRSTRVWLMPVAPSILSTLNSMNTCWARKPNPIIQSPLTNFSFGVLFEPTCLLGRLLRWCEW